MYRICIRGRVFFSLYILFHLFICFIRFGLYLLYLIISIFVAFNKFFSLLPCHHGPAGHTMCTLQICRFYTVFISYNFYRQHKKMYLSTFAVCYCCAAFFYCSSFLCHRHTHTHTLRRTLCVLFLCVFDYFVFTLAYFSRSFFHAYVFLSYFLFLFLFAHTKKHVLTTLVYNIIQG